MNEPVNFEIAKLLFDKGFEQKERPSYLLVPFEECTTMDIFDHPTANLGYGDMIGYYLPNKTVNAPTIAEVVMWLYENHGIWVSVSYELNIENHKKEWFWIAIKDGKEIDYAYINFNSPYINFNSPTEAYKAGITHTLEKI